MQCEERETELPEPKSLQEPVRAMVQQRQVLALLPVLQERECEGRLSEARGRVQE